MGHGASIYKESSSSKSVILSAELQVGSQNLSLDQNLRLSFVNYIKSGEWLDQLAIFVPQIQPKRKSSFIINMGGELEGAISKYQISKHKFLEIESLISGASSKSISQSISTTNSSVTRKRTDSDIKMESYFNIDDSNCFNTDQYMAMLFHILYPIFLASPQFERYIHHGIEHGRVPRDDSSSDQGNGELVLSADSKRLQDIILGCAAYFDESHLDKRLQRSAWLADVTNALDNHLRGVVVVDIRRDGGNIVYANRAFQALSEFAPKDLWHGNLSMLNGPNTEAAQLLLLREAMQPMQTAKFAITYYNKSKRAFTDLLAVKTTEHYSVMVHFPAVKGANLDDLKEVDDLLILAAQVLRASPEPAPGLGW